MNLLISSFLHLIHLSARRHRMWYAWMPAVVVQRLNPWISVDNQRENMNKMNEHHETLRDVEMV